MLWYRVRKRATGNYKVRAIIRKISTVHDCVMRIYRKTSAIIMIPVQKACVVPNQLHVPGIVNPSIVSGYLARPGHHLPVCGLFWPSLDNVSHVVELPKADRYPAVQAGIRQDGLERGRIYGAAGRVVPVQPIHAVYRAYLDNIPWSLRNHGIVYTFAQLLDGAIVQEQGHIKVDYGAVEVKPGEPFIMVRYAHGQRLSNAETYTEFSIRGLVLDAAAAHHEVLRFQVQNRSVRQSNIRIVDHVGTDFQFFLEFLACVYHTGLIPTALNDSFSHTYFPLATLSVPKL